MPGFELYKFTNRRRAGKLPKSVRKSLKLKREQMVTKVIFVTHGPVKTRVWVGTIKKEVQSYAGELFEQQFCTVCRAKPSGAKLLPLPDNARSIPEMYYLHLLVHLALPYIRGATSRKTRKKIIKERIYWQDKANHRLAVVLHIPLKKTKVLNELAQASLRLKKFLKTQGGAAVA